MNFVVKLLLVLAFIAFLQQCQRKNSSLKPISVDEVYHIINDSVSINEYVLIDILKIMDYVGGHLVSAFCISPDSIKHKIETIVNERRPLIIYDSAGTLQNSKVVNIFSEYGVTNFYVMDGGFSKWTKHGYPAAIQLVRNTSERISIQSADISTTEAYEIIKSRGSEYVVIDIRSYPAFQESHIEGAISIPYVPINEFVVHIEEQNFARDKPIILYCEAYSDIGEKANEVMLRNDFSRRSEERRVGKE